MSPATDDDRRRDGMTVRRQVLGDTHVDAAGAAADEFTGDFQDFITRYAWGDIWQRPGLARRDRSIAVLTALVAHGHLDELGMHVRAAVRNGLTEAEIKEVLLQSGIYVGVPAANSAFKVAQGVLAELHAEQQGEQQDGDGGEKVFDVEHAVAGIPDGSTVLIGGFGNAGQPWELIDALRRQGARDLTVVNNNAGNGEVGLAALLAAGQVRKIVCSFPRQKDSQVFDELYRSGKIELELVPQGNLAERIRAGGAGIGGFFTPTGYGTAMADGKETRTIDGRGYVLEAPIRADYALIKAHRADVRGNLVYRKTARNFGPIMAAAAATTIAQVTDVLPLGAIDPENVVTPGIYVDRVVPIDPGDDADRDTDRTGEEQA